MCAYDASCQRDTWNSVLDTGISMALFSPPWPPTIPFLSFTCSVSMRDRHFPLQGKKERKKYFTASGKMILCSLSLSCLNGLYSAR